MENLRRFNDDKATKNALIEYINDFISSEGVKLIYERKDVSHVADAHDLITRAFQQIEIDYGVQPKQSEPINEAR